MAVGNKEMQALMAARQRAAARAGRLRDPVARKAIAGAVKAADVAIERLGGKVAVRGKRGV